MTNSILETVKKLLGIDVNYHDFDVDVITCTNAVLMAINQMGIGKEGFIITGNSEEWTDFIDGTVNLNAIQTYVYLRVRMLFDPPTQSSVMEAYNNQIKEYEWRLFVNQENYNYSKKEDENA